MGGRSDPMAMLSTVKVFQNGFRTAAGYGKACPAYGMTGAVTFANNPEQLKKFQLFQ